MSKDEKPVKKLDTADPDSAAQAREQAVEYGSSLAPTELKLDDGSVIMVPPHPQIGLIDEDGQALIDQLNLDLESHDRGPDIFIPEQKVKDSAGNEITLPSDTRPGPLLEPYRKTDPDTKQVVLMNPPYRAQLAKYALGDEDYARLRAGKVGGLRGSAADVWRIWTEQSLALSRRQRDDSKSVGSTVDSAPVPASDPS